MPPINSKFSSLDIFEDVEKEIFNFSTENKCICLVGDFNSRVSTLKDYTDHDEFAQTCKFNNLDWTDDQFDYKC